MDFAILHSSAGRIVLLLIYGTVISFLYFTGICIYCFAIRITAWFNTKARQWVDGRKNWKKNLKSEVSGLKGQTVWIHCSSLGEFEQARPLVDGIASEYSGVNVVVSFFSPSGYNIRRNYQHASLVVYLPCDAPGNAAYFIKTINPAIAIFVKYDLWYGYFKALKRFRIPLLLVSVVQHKALTNSPGDFYKKLCFSLCDRIYVQDEISRINISKAIGTEVIKAGDTRIDSVMKFAGLTEDKLENDILKFKANSKCLICGSTWAKDETLLVRLINHEVFKGWKAVIAPHEIKKDSLERLKASFGTRAIFYSNFGELTCEHQVLIVDSVGFLSKLYRYGDMAYIGGGFGSGIHNTLEPAAFGLPVIFGPKYRKFTEAVGLIEEHAFISIQHENELKEAFAHFSIQENKELASASIRNYLESNRGASEKILNDIKSHYLSTSE